MNERYLVTGASRGIGRAVALQLAREGKDLCCGYHKSQKEAFSLKEEVEAMGVECLLLQGDLAKPEDCQNMMAEVSAQVGRLTGIVLCGGIAQMGLFQDCSDQEWAEMMGVHLTSIHSLLSKALPPMISAQLGSIVTLSSIWGEVGASYEVAYSTAKAGVIGLTKALAKELGPSQIRVNCVAPGVIDTDMISQISKEDRQCLTEEIPLGRVGTVEEVAEVVCFLLSPKASYLTGQVLSPNGGWGG